MNRLRLWWLWYSWRASRLRERGWMWLAWHLPRPLAYWAAIRLGANATTGAYSSQVVPDLRLTEALERW